MRMGTELFQHLGTIWGWGQPKFWGFIGAYPQKNPKVGDGDGVTAPKMVGKGLGKNPRKSPNSGWGQGKESQGFLPHY